MGLASKLQATQSGQNAGPQYARQQMNPPQMQPASYPTNGTAMAYGNSQMAPPPSTQPAQAYGTQTAATAYTNQPTQAPYGYQPAQMPYRNQPAQMPYGNQPAQMPYGNQPAQTPNIQPVATATATNQPYRPANSAVPNYPQMAPPSYPPPGGMAPGYHNPNGPMTQMPPSMPPSVAPSSAYPTSAPQMAPSNAVGAGFQNRLQTIIRANGLDRFYPPQQLANVVARLQSVDFAAVAREWRMTTELAYDFAALALYDIVIYADDSGSMAFEENGSRIDDLKLIIHRVTQVATMFDDDGISIRMMNSPAQGNNIRSVADVDGFIGQIKFSGTTPLGTNLETKVLQPLVYSALNQGALRKPVLIITVTDGEPSPEPRWTIRDVMVRAKNYLQQRGYGPGTVAFEFAQVGRDQGAQRFLAELDSDPEVGKQIDATSYYELEAEEYAKKGVTLTPELWLVKLMLGAVDPSYDEQD